MDKQRKKGCIGLFICIALMFVWIFITVWLTGGREIEEFSSTDQWIWIGFAVVEIITVIILFRLAVKIGRRNQAAAQQIMGQKAPRQDRGFLLYLAAIFTALLLQIFGILCAKKLTDALSANLKWIIAVCCGIPVIFLLLNIVLQKLFVRRLQRKPVGDMQQYFLSHRESAEETSKRKLTLVKRLRVLTDLYAVLLCVFGAVVAFCNGALLNSGLSTWLCFVAAFFLLCGFSRIRFPLPKKMFDEDKTYVQAREYPTLYALARRAADTLHCSGEIRIAVRPNCNAGIAKVGNLFSIELGVILLSVVSSEELYNILLHEFAHMCAETNGSDTDARYNTWLCNGGTAHFLSGLTRQFYSFFDALYNFQFVLYSYASSILKESAADQAMCRCGDSEIAASALLKLKYYDLFQWEKGTGDEECLLIPEQPEKRFLTKEIEAFRRAIAVRGEDWDHLADVEILARGASHPTLKMRLEALGVNRIGTVERADPAPYRRECEKALEYVEALIYAERAKTYGENREVFYLRPKKTVEDWEAAGRPVVAEEYADVVSALRDLGRVTEANGLCERAIAELSGAASCFGYYMKGCWLLHSYDPAGIEYIYRAIGGNSNYIEEGMQMIGEFCCLTGRQEELDTYREKAVALLQKTKDVYNEIGVLRKTDRLSGETLPDGLLEEILTYIHSIEDGEIEKIYLVRKTITDAFFTSAFVVSFVPGIDTDIRQAVMHKIFNYLDTCSDWQFSLFDYGEVAGVKVETIENSCVYTKNH